MVFDKIPLSRDETYNTVEFQVYGRYALFTDPVTRAGGDKISYQIPTYEALKGIMESIYWHPVLIWVIDRVRVINEIQMEPKGVRLYGYNKKHGDLACYTYLKDVRYQVQAHFIYNPNQVYLTKDRKDKKHINIARRAIERGGRRNIFLGTRECQGYVEPCVFGEGHGFYDNLPEEVSYGLMYHGITYADSAILLDEKGHMTINFWEPRMKPGGYIDYIRPEQCFKAGQGRKMEPKIFHPAKSQET